MNRTIKSLIISVFMIAVSASVFAANKKSIVCTTFPEYDWIMNILGEKSSAFDVTLLQNNGTDLHSYQPSVKDIAKISRADLFVYVGGESDEWVEKVLSQAANKNQIAVNMMEVLGDKIREEEIIEGMQAEEEHSHAANFTEADVKDRTLAEWNGTWQSTYPHFLNGTLDRVWEHKAESDPAMSAKDYKNKYEIAYNTEFLSIKINKNTVEYITESGNIKANYKAAGFVFRIKDDGSAQARFKFEKTSGNSKAPKFIVFSDHNYEPSKPEHFHLYYGDKDFASIEFEDRHFPTYYPENMTGEEIADSLIGGHHHHKEEPEYDEHVWLSIKNAIDLTNILSSNIQKLDYSNAAVYKKNTENYVAQLSALDKEYEKAVASANKKIVLFGDRYPFRYLTDDYNLKYFAAFVGCSAESEASFETVVFLSKKVDELGLNAVLTIEKSDKKIAKTIISSTKSKDQQILEMDSLQSITQAEIKSGRNYLSTMEKNLDILKKALN